ncbi:MAG: acyltransferase [Candidatus Margulisiibacteriota bacterium]|jgi:acetyltransferase-like isoleucine patch superfamily enzyme
MDNKEFKKLLLLAINNQDNSFHPFAFINGKPEIGKNVCIGFFSEINAKAAKIVIGDDCDIASFVAINAADSHKKCTGLAKEIERKDITLENNVFVGSHCFIGKGVYIGHHSVVGAGTIISKPCRIPPYSLVVGNPFKIKEGYYKKLFKK